MSCSTRKSFKMHQKNILLLTILCTIISLSLVSCDSFLNKTNGENLTSPILECKEDEKCRDMMHSRIRLVQKLDDFARETDSILTAYHTERLKHSSVIYGLIVTAEENQLNQKCYNEIMQIYHGINRKEIWAMKSEF